MINAKHWRALLLDNPERKLLVLSLLSLGVIAVWSPAVCVHTRTGGRSPEQRHSNTLVSGLESAQRLYLVDSIE